MQHFTSGVLVVPGRQSSRPLPGCIAIDCIIFFHHPGCLCPKAAVDAQSSPYLLPVADYGHGCTNKLGFADELKSMIDRRRIASCRTSSTTLDPQSKTPWLLG
jgi:hypothetical protein